MDGSRTGSIGPSRSKSTTSSHRLSPTSGRERSTAPDQSLLMPVVRSKRTPIACTECRRRQVKCTGGTPQCERCEKRGVKCEYIPIHQQRLSTSGATSAQSHQAAVQLHNYPLSQTSRSVPSSPVPWQQAGSTYQGQLPSVSQAEWQHQYLPSAPAPPAQSFNYAQQSIQSAPAHLGAAYSQAYQPNPSYAPTTQATVRTDVGYIQSQVSPPEYGYSSVSSYDAYGQLRGTSTSSSASVGYDYRTNIQYQAGTMPTNPPAAYSTEYYQTQPTSYTATSGVTSSEDVYSAWTNPANPNYAQDSTYGENQSHQYPS